MNPILPLSDQFILPGSISELVVFNPVALTSIDYHLNTQKALLVLPLLKKTDYPKQEDIFVYGTSARILRSLDIDSHSKRILLEGLKRIRIDSFTVEDGFGYFATPYAFQEVDLDEEHLSFWQSKLRSLIHSFMKSNSDVHPDLLPLLEIKEGDGRFINMCAAQLNLSAEQRLLFLAQQNRIERIQLLISHLHKEQEFNELNSKIIEEVQNKIEQQNKAYFIRNHIEELHKELKENDPPVTDRPALKKIQSAIEEIPPPPKIKKCVNHCGRT